MEHHGEAGTAWVHLLPLLATAGLLAAYLTVRMTRRPALPAWSRARTISFTIGCLLLALAFWPAVSVWAMTDFRGHMTQHLLVGMAAPLALVLGAPVTLALGSISPASGRLVMALMRTRGVWVLTRPPVALVLTVGPMAAMYFTPLYAWATSSSWAHLVLHAHFLASGYLFAWVIAGPDPAPHRASVKARIITVGVAVVIHASVSQLMYAGIGVQVPAPVDEIRGGATLMYFGGDLIEICLALALLSSWRTRSRPAPSGDRAAAGVRPSATGR